MFKNKMNVYGFILIVLLWIVAMVLFASSVPKMESVALYIAAIVVFLMFLLAKKIDTVFSVVALILGLVAATSISTGFVTLPAGTIGLGISYLFFAFVFIKSESTTLNILAWAQILCFLLIGLFGFWNVPVLARIFIGIGNALVGLIFVYYLAGEAGINLPGNIDEKIKEKIG